MSKPAAPAPAPQLDAETTRAWAVRGFTPTWFDDDPVVGSLGPVGAENAGPRVPGLRFGGAATTLTGALDGLPNPNRPFGLDTSYHATDADLRAVAGLRNLTHLSLGGSQAVTDFGLSHLAPLQNLTHLDLSGTRITDDGVRELMRFPKLTVLSLRGTKVTGSGLAPLAALKNLRVLDLSQTAVTGSGLRALGELNLVHLNLSNTPLTDAAARYLATCTTLTSLKLDGKWSEAGLQELAPLTGLKVLQVCWPVGNGAELAGLAHVPNLDTLIAPINDDVLAVLRRSGKLHTLAQARSERGRPKGPGDVIVLDLSGAPVTGTGLKELIDFKNLDTLILLHTKVTDGLTGLTGLKNLTTLSISSDTRTAPADLKALAALDSLDTLDLSNCYLVPGTARAVASIPNLVALTVWATDSDVRELPALKHLRALRVGGGGISNDGVWDLAKIKTLRELSLTGARRVTDDGAKDLATLPELAVLDLTGTGVGDEGAGALAGVTSLRTLRLGGTGVTSTGAVALARNNRLVALDLSATKVDGPGIEALGALKSLEYLDLSNSFAFTDGSAKALAGLPELRALNLGNTGVTVLGWKHLAGTKSLTWLILPRVQQTDVPELLRFTKLTRLQVDGAHFLTDPDRDQVRGALSACEVVFSAPPGPMPWPTTDEGP